MNFKVVAATINPTACGVDYAKLEAIHQECCTADASKVSIMNVLKKCPKRYSLRCPQKRKRQILGAEAPRRPTACGPRRPVSAALPREAVPTQPALVCREFGNLKRSTIYDVTAQLSPAHQSDR